MRRRALALLGALAFVAAGCASTTPTQDQQQPRLHPNSNQNPDTDAR